MISTTLVECEPILDFPVQGANSHAYLANDPNLKREIAVKDIRNSSIKKRQVDDYFQEARIAALATHPLVMQVYYVGFDETNGIARVVTPYYPNGCMQTRINNLLGSNKLLSIKEIISRAIEIGQGLNHLHSLGILHLDIKPSNLILSNDGKTIVTDFGQSKLLNGSQFATDLRLYHKNMTPEFLQHGVADYRSDVYQFGLLLYRLCNENILNNLLRRYSHVDELKRDILAGSFPDRGRFNVHVPNALIKLIRTCLDVDPANRFPDFYTVINELCSIEGYDLDLDLTSKVMLGNKNGKAYSVEYTKDNTTDRFSVVFKVNGRRKSSFCKANMTEYQLRNTIKKGIAGGG